MRPGQDNAIGVPRQVFPLDQSVSYGILCQEATVIASSHYAWVGRRHGDGHADMITPLLESARHLDSTQAARKPCDENARSLTWHDAGCWWLFKLFMDWWSSAHRHPESRFAAGKSRYSGPGSALGTAAGPMAFQRSSKAKIALGGLQARPCCGWQPA